MEIKLSCGTAISITSAFRDDYGEIHITCADSFALLTKLSGFRVISASLIDWEEVWCLTVGLEIPEEYSDEYENYYFFELSGQDQIQRLNAFL